MNILTRPIAATFALILAASSAFAAEAIMLKQQWQVGKSYSQKMTMDQTTSITILDQKMDQSMNLVAEMTSTVRKHEDGTSKRIGIKYEKMVMNTDMNGQKMTIDSSKAAADSGPMGNPFAAFTGKEIKMVVDANDKVTAFENFDEIAKAAGGANPITSAFLNKEAISRTIQQSGLQALPAKPVTPGESWPFSVEMPLAGVGKGEVKGTYTFKGVTPHGGVPCAEIAVDGTINFDMSSAGAADAENPVAKMGMKIEGGTMKGTIWFDNALGMSRGSDLKQEMTMTMKNPTNPSETMKLPMKQSITTELTKVEDVK